MYLKKLKLPVILNIILGFLMIGCGFSVLAADQTIKEVETKGEVIISKVAPGEILPISVKLINFGGGRRVDVTINYQIVDCNDVVMLEESETVAVETTASFIKNIQIPYCLSNGRYTAVSNIIYEGQEVPAISKFQFTVEKKIAGIFVSQLIVYGIATLLIGIVFAVLSRLVIKRRFCRFTPHKYENVSKKDRIFYEIISDMIMQMRQHKGDEAIDIAKKIDGLKIDENSGQVLSINKDPAEIVALLMLYYEKNFNEKVNIDMSKASKEKVSSIDQNIEIIKKYFR